MTTPKTPIIKKATSKNNIITFGDVIAFEKMPNLEIEDQKNGISRSGGCRIPNYSIAYLKSAAILIEYGIKNNVLDEIGMPALYMQRHSLELMLKQVLTELYQLAKWQVELGKHNFIPSKSQIGRLTSQHKLMPLWTDLKSASTQMGFLKPPIELLNLIKNINEFEKGSDTFTRYESSGNTQHLENEIELPIIELQKKLERVNSKIALQDNIIHNENTLHFIETGAYINEILRELQNCIVESQS